MGERDSKPEKDSKVWKGTENPEEPGVSRRDFLRISGITAALPLVARPNVVLAAGAEIPVQVSGTRSAPKFGLDLHHKAEKRHSEQKP